MKLFSLWSVVFTQQEFENKIAIGLQSWRVTHIRKNIPLPFFLLECVTVVVLEKDNSKNSVIVDASLSPHSIV